MHRLNRLALLLAGWLLAGTALAQAWPTRPITMLIPFPPGTGNDIIGRVLGPKMAEVLGQPVVADNRSGASGNIAMEATAKAAPDGYTIVVGSTSYTINLYTLKGTAPLSAFTPVALVGKLPYSLMLSPQVPARNMNELVALLKAKQGAYNAATGGPTGATFFLTESFKKAAGLDLTMVNYKGTTEAVADLIEGRTHILFAPLATAIPQLKAGKTRILGLTGSQRSPLIPDVPTFIEAGFPTLDVPSWFAMMGPAGIPRPVVNRLSDATNKALSARDVLDRLASVGVEATPGSPDEADAFIRQNAGMWAKMVKDAGVEAK